MLLDLLQDTQPDTAATGMGKVPVYTWKYLVLSSTARTDTLLKYFAGTWQNTSKYLSGTEDNTGT